MGADFKFIQVNNDPELLKKIYRLRYEVYCEETKFLNAGEYPDRMETDAYDLAYRSLHFAAIDNEKNLAGSIRLILNSDLPFPLEKKCPSLFINIKKIPKGSIAEISRLVIQKTKRRRPEDGLFGVESYLLQNEGGVLNEPGISPPPPRQQNHERRKQPVIILGLYRAMYHASKKRNLTFWYAAMEKKLWYALKRFSFPFTPIGPEINYYGPVIPYLGDIAEIENVALQTSPKMLAYMLEGLDKKYHPKSGKYQELNKKQQTVHVHKYL